MTALIAHLTRQIAATGPISLADYMAICLMHPQHGYYSTRDPFGAVGDFVTAPEISQMFGELLGLCLAQTWLDQGAPAPFILAELGPGRGTLMADLLRATKAVPGFHAAARLHLVEASPTLRAAQAQALGGQPTRKNNDSRAAQQAGPAPGTHTPENAPPHTPENAPQWHMSDHAPQWHMSDHAPQWHDTIHTLPDAPLFLIANEFFDALPIRQFQREGSSWRERVVGLKDGALSLGLADPAPQPGLTHRLEDTRDGDVVETCAPAATIAAQIGSRIARHGGAALIVDYGDWRSLGDTLQALEKHAPADPFANPGQADLTAHVDFEALAAACSPAAHSRLTPQGVFLERLGITARAQALAASLSGPALDSHIAAHRRLTHPSEMGSVFKTLALMPRGAPPLAGLQP